LGVDFATSNVPQFRSKNNATPDAQADAWPATLADLRSQMTPATFDANLAGTTTTLNDNKLTIHCPANGSAERLTHQAIGQQVARAVRVHFGEVEVIFVAAEHEAVEVEERPPKRTGAKNHDRSYSRKRRSRHW
jgi:hypothetical protein